jgi:hypothetical protein
MNGYGRIVKCLVVGVAKHECYIVNALAVHVVNSVAASATYTNNLDDAMLLLRCSEVKDI